MDSESIYDICGAISSSNNDQTARGTTFITSTTDTPSSVPSNEEESASTTPTSPVNGCAQIQSELKQHQQHQTQSHHQQQQQQQHALECFDVLVCIFEYLLPPGSLDRWSLVTTKMRFQPDDITISMRGNVALVCKAWYNCLISFRKFLSMQFVIPKDVYQFGPSHYLQQQQQQLDRHRQRQIEQAAASAGGGSSTRAVLSQFSFQPPRLLEPYPAMLAARYLKETVLGNAGINALTIVAIPPASNNNNINSSSVSSCPQIPNNFEAALDLFHQDEEGRKAARSICDQITCVEYYRFEVVNVVPFLKFHATLESMTISRCGKIVTNSSRNCFPQLRRLLIHECNVSDSDIVAISQAFPNLEELTITGCRSSIKSPVITFPELRKLDLSHSSKLSRPVVNCPKLQQLCLSHCDRVFSDECLAAVLSHKNLKNLISLDVSHCTWLRSPQIRSQSLQTLVMRGCGFLAQPFVDCPNLSLLDLTSCSSRRIQQAVLESLRSSIPVVLVD